MQTGKRGFAYGVEIFQVGMPLFIHPDSTAGVVRSGHHRNGLLGDIYAQLKAARIDRGKVLKNGLDLQPQDARLLKRDGLHVGTGIA